jgi:hypothetical protein
MLKVFEILAGRFQHDEEKFRIAFEATAVVCQYKLKNELQLYNVLIQAAVDADDNDASTGSSTSTSDEENASDNEEESDKNKEDESSQEDDVKNM